MKYLPAFIVTILAVFCVIMFGWIQWTIERDMHSVIMRAYTASTASESLDYLSQFRDILVERDLDEGYTAFWFNSAKTDLSAKMRNLDSCIERMESLAQQEESGIHDMAYQTGMAELIEELGGENGMSGQYSVGTLAWKPAFWWGLLFWPFALIACGLWTLPK